MGEGKRVEGDSTRARAPEQRPWWLNIAVVAIVGVALLLIMGGILAGVAIPAYRNKVVAANEAVALNSLRSIAAEEANYVARAGHYATLPQLVEASALDARFAGDPPSISGYVLTMKVQPVSDDRPPFFSVNADPVQSGGFAPTGKRHFYLDSEVTGIRVSEGRQATAHDRPRE